MAQLTKSLVYSGSLPSTKPRTTAAATTATTRKKKAFISTHRQLKQREKSKIMILLDTIKLGRSYPDCSQEKALCRSSHQFYITRFHYIYDIQINSIKKILQGKMELSSNLGMGRVIYQILFCSNVKTLL